MTNAIDYYELGRAQCQAHYASQAYTGLSESIPAEEAMKLYWPCVEEQNVQIPMPLPQPRQKWLKGFKKAQIEIHAQRLVTCKCCGQLLPTKEKTDEER